MTKWRVLLSSLLVLALAGTPARAALSGGEKKAYDAAVEEFGYRLWDRAEAAFADFIAKFPKSEKLSEAIVRQAEAQFRQGKYATAEALLTAREGDAGGLADQFLYWRAEAQFQEGNYRAAAENFGRLAREYRTSGRRLEAAVGEAAAQARLGEWEKVIELLRKPENAFRQAALGLTNETVARGYLLQAEAHLAQKQWPEAEASLIKVGAELPLELEWRRRNVLCRALLGSNRPEDAERESVGLVSTAEDARRVDLVSESIVLRADILEQLGKWTEAITVLKRNLSTNAPVARQEQALARITTLAMTRGQYDVASETLEAFLTQYPAAPAAPMALLTLGEVHLKEFAGVLATNRNGLPAVAVTNHLQPALSCFDRVLTVYTNSNLAGRAQLGRGWCYWLEEKYAESSLAFGAAADALPPSADLVVARFKQADALFQQTNYAGALINYRAALLAATNAPEASAELRLPALYQSLRASLALTNFEGAHEAVRAILAVEPQDSTAASSLLLVAQGHLDVNQPDEARRAFEQFVALFPNSALRPQAELLIARVLEQQGAWTNAIAAYDGWLTLFPTNDFRPQVEFQRALAVARSGSETNALSLFTNFVARYRTNELAPRAQWWVADYFFSRGEFAEAEINFKQLFQNWKSSELTYEARMMAGRSAIQWSGFQNAIEYFTNLTSDASCPPDLWARAVLAYGGVRMRLAPAETNRLAGYTAALQVFGQIHQRSTNNEYAALAWGEMGNCHLQMATLDARNYEAAASAYQRVMALPAAGVTARSQAQCGLGQVLEKLAEAGSGEERKALLLRARDAYLDVALEKNLREGETADEFWVKKAGLEAVRLLELMQGWPTQDAQTIVSVCQRLQQVLPTLTNRFDAVIRRVQSPTPTENK